MKLATSFLITKLACANLAARFSAVKFWNSGIFTIVR